MPSKKINLIHLLLCHTSILHIYLVLMCDCFQRGVVSNARCSHARLQLWTVDVLRRSTHWLIEAAVTPDPMQRSGLYSMNKAPYLLIAMAH